MDAFNSLVVGARFDTPNNEAALKLFSLGEKASRSSAVPDALSSRGTLTGRAEEDACASVPLPLPSPTLSLFGSAPRSGGDAKDGASEGSGSAHHPSSSSVQDTPLKSMTFKRMRNLWRRNDLQVTGVDLPGPIEHFSDLVRPPLNVPRSVVNNLFQREHKIPTPIQMQAIPSLIHQRDVLACAPTGSGKTIAFLVPLFARLKEPDPSAGVRALIVTPTVELAQQIEREAFFLMKGQRWKFVQHGQTTKNKDIFIATPGRIVSLLHQNLLSLSAVQYLVFDEGDRLWDTKTDFLVVVDKILTACSRKEKVVSLFTATLSERVEEAARSVMGSDPIRIIVHGRRNANTNVKQQLLFCGNELGKIVAMRNMICEGITPPVLIFVQSIERSKDLYAEIRAKGLHMAVINAKMSVEERDEVVLQFRLGKVWILITTELLSRGIDFKNVKTVINFDFPATADSYIHRIGRTGRAGREGTAITFFTEADRDRLPPIAKIMRESGSEVEDWMLEIKVDHDTRRRLERTTPHRMIVNTRKRIMVADKRTKSQYRRLEAEEAAEKEKKKKKRPRKTDVQSESDEGEHD